MPYTTHGHWFGESDPTGPAPQLVARCGGPHLCTVCALEAHRADAATQQPQGREPMAVTIGVTPEPKRLIRMLRIIASHAAEARRELAELPIEETIAALAIISRHADGCADQLEALDQDDAPGQRAGGDGPPPQS